MMDGESEAPNNPGEGVLKKLWQAGASGVAMSQFGFETRKGRAQLEGALGELIAQNKIVRVGEGRRAMCFLTQFAPTTESVRQKLEATALTAHAALLSKSDLSSNLLPAEEPFFSQALGGLLAEKRLVKLAKQPVAGRETEFFMHASTLRELFAATFPENGEARGAGGDLLAAYEKLVECHGFPDVEIFELHQHAGLSLAALKEQILAEHEAGRAVLSFGDWSLASAETRSGAIEMNGDRYLRVRFQN